MPINVLQPASLDNFNEEGYLCVNPDLRAARAENATFDLLEHLKQFGLKEERNIVPLEFFKLRETKFRRFADVLNLSGSYGFMNKKNAFPVVTTGRSFQIDQYDGESACGTASFVTSEMEQNPDKLYVDLGCGFRNVVYENCIYIEVYPSVTADVVMSPNTPIPFKDESVDGLACLAVLEHVENPWYVAQEIKRVVKPGGKIFIDWPFLQPIHGYPSHYYNATAMGLRRMFTDTFDVLELKAFNYQRSDFTLNWIIGWYVLGLREGPIRERFVNMRIVDLLHEKPQGEFYRELLENLDPEMDNKLACGNTLVARKRQSSKGVNGHCQDGGCYLAPVHNPVAIEQSVAAGVDELARQIAAMNARQIQVLQYLQGQDARIGKILTVAKTAKKFFAPVRAVGRAYNAVRSRLP